MIAHTPGPWRAEHTSRGTVRIEAPTGLVATIDKHHHGKGPQGVVEAGANASLIAAAPDLLAALRMVQAQRDVHDEPEDVAWAAVVAAIARATALAI